MTKLFKTVGFFLTICAPFSFCLQLSGQHVQYSGNHSVTWEECIYNYQQLDALSEFAKLTVCGTTDIGKPLHLFIINKDQIFYPELFDKKKTIIMINNGIHPGEPDGIDASLMLASELLIDESNLAGLLDSVILCIIPIYNVDGSLNRSSYSRANQNGPDAYGFRGNARNLDLNRDFIKCDSKNAISFNSIFNRIQPHILVDTHVSNGADYPYVMTLITTQTDKLGGSIGKYLKEKMEPALFEAMKKSDFEMSPYVNTMGRTPENGLSDFLETPRFATGYAALFNTIGFTTETHMLKPFDQRVESTYMFLLNLLRYADSHSMEIMRLRAKADSETLNLKKYAMSYQLDTGIKESLFFRGYESRTSPSEIGSGEVLMYDRELEWSRDIPLYRKYRPKVEVDIPEFYIIPQAWSEVITRLKLNGVALENLRNDTALFVDVYSILDYQSGSHPYEGHFLHTNVKVAIEAQKIKFYAGDFIVRTSQKSRRYICEVLEPQSEDGFFAWNFFDSVLQQKEWFSDYVFENIAVDLLKNDLELKKRFDDVMKNDSSITNSHWNQLYWIYKQSKYFENSVNRYPVYRHNGKLKF